MFPKIKLRSWFLALVMIAALVPVIPASAASGAPACPSALGAAAPPVCVFGTASSNHLKGVMVSQNNTLDSNGSAPALPPISVKVPAGMASLIVDAMSATFPNTATASGVNETIGVRNPDAGASFTFGGSPSGPMAGDTVVAAVLLDHASSTPVTVPLMVTSAAGKTVVDLVIPGWMTVANGFHLYSQSGSLVGNQNSVAPMSETWTASAPIFNAGAGWVSSLNLPAGTNYANINYRIPANAQITVSQSFPLSSAAAKFTETSGLGIPYVLGGNAFAPVQAPSAPVTPKAPTPKATPKAALTISGPSTVQPGVPAHYSVNTTAPVAWSTNLPNRISASGLLFPWAPSNGLHWTMNASGVFSQIPWGPVTITATTRSGLKASKTVTVLPLVLSLRGPASLRPGQTATYRVTGVPNGMPVRWLALVNNRGTSFVDFTPIGTSLKLTVPAGATAPIAIQATLADGQVLSRTVAVAVPFPWWFVGVLVFAALMLLAAEIRRRRRTTKLPKLEPTIEAEAS